MYSLSKFVDVAYVFPATEVKKKVEPSPNQITLSCLQINQKVWNRHPLSLGANHHPLCKPETRSFIFIPHTPFTATQQSPQQNGENGEQIRSPVIQKKSALMESNNQNLASLISPRFKSTAATVGWDEEALFLAALIVEDTPDRDSKQKKRLVLSSKSPLSPSANRFNAQQQTSVVNSLCSTLTSHFPISATR
ncbi:unnamed protein product [Vicia faba]|uniref:Uncharacterized protein n=1 Tax=Vicia faba TaxID=3906 RepID=A0AAV1B009_VICFA|nr:unnamed protein product [Vicia faba]